MLRREETILLSLGKSSLVFKQFYLDNNHQLNLNGCQGYASFMGKLLKNVKYGGKLQCLFLVFSSDCLKLRQNADFDKSFLEECLIKCSVVIKH